MLELVATSVLVPVPALVLVDSAVVVAWLAYSLHPVVVMADATLEMEDASEPALAVHPKYEQRTDDEIEDETRRNEHCHSIHERRRMVAVAVAVQRVIPPTLLLQHCSLPLPQLPRPQLLHLPSV